LIIKECDDDDDKQKWSYENGKIRSCDKEKLCITTSGSSLKLKDCSSKRDKEQTFSGFSSLKKFQLHPKGKSSRCMSQDHHPTKSEKLKMMDCEEAEKNDKGVYDDTSHWVIGKFKGN